LFEISVQRERTTFKHSNICQFHFLSAEKLLLFSLCVKMGDIENPAFEQEVHKKIEETNFDEYVFYKRQLNNLFFKASMILTMKSKNHPIQNLTMVRFLKRTQECPQKC